MNERRQRGLRADVAGVIILGALMLAGGCQARSTVEGAQTAIAVAQTAVPVAQTMLPGLQATAEAGATSVAGVLSDGQAVTTVLEGPLAGARIQLHTAPPGAANDAVTDVSLSATDANGTLGQLDMPSRQTAAGAAMLVAAQYYPHASIALSVVDASGTLLVGGSKAPGQAPSFQ